MTVKISKARVQRTLKANFITGARSLRWFPQINCGTIDRGSGVRVEIVPSLFGSELVFSLRLVSLRDEQCIGSYELLD